MKRKNLVASLLALAMLLSMFSGCSSQSSASATASIAPTASGAASNSPYKTNLKISIANWGIKAGIDSGKEDKVRDYIYNKFNITIDPVDITWDDYKTKINTWAAAGSLPDVFVDDAITETNFTKWATQGVIQALPTDLSAYPIVKKYLDQKDVQDYKYPVGSKDSKYYCIPHPTYSNMDMWANDNACLIRLDWMKKVGVTKVPTTMEEFSSLMQKFVKEDPDGNGKNDTVGLTCYSAAWLGNFFTGYEPALSFPSLNNWTKATNGSWIPAFMTANALTGVNALKKLYDDGALDKDFATLKGDEGKNKFISGTAGAFVNTGYPTTLNNVYTGMLKINPKLDWANTVALVPPFKAADGNYYRNIASTPWAETYFSTGCSAEKVDRVLALINWGLSDEGFNIMHYGFEGEDYTKSGDTITPIEKKDDTGKVVANIMTYPILANGFSGLFSWNQDFSYKNPAIPEVVRKTANDMLDWELKNCKPTPTNLTLNFITYDSKSKATFILQDELTKAILSKDATVEWNQMIANYRKNGYDQVIKDVNAKATELGITSYTE